MIGPVRGSNDSQAKTGLRGLYVDFPTSSGSMRVLREIDLVAYRGEFVTLIGPSGCGKSTLLNVVAGLQASTAGKVIVDGRVSAGRLGTDSYMPQKDLHGDLFSFH